jgi:hypothetical protein
VGGLRLERWAPSRQNDGRHQIGIGGRLTSESACRMMGISKPTLYNYVAEASA